MKVLIGKNATVLETSGCTHSIEAGQHDGLTHFDHHGQFEGQKCPCANTDIKPDANAVVGTTHLDADTLVGVTRILKPDWIRKAERSFEAEKSVNHVEPWLNWAEMAQHDMKAANRPRGLTPTKCFMLGLTGVERVACPAEGTTDCTSTYQKIWSTPIDQIINSGRKIGVEAEEVYKRAIVWEVLSAKGKKIGVWALRGNEQMDPARPYDDGFDIVVIWRERFQSFSVYANDNVMETFPGVWAGYTLAGHPHACGSERGKQFILAAAEEVAAAIADKL